jgi:hypothetical protein
MHDKTFFRWQVKWFVLYIQLRHNYNTIDVYLCSGDTDGRVPVTSSRLSVNQLQLPVAAKWRPWFSSAKVLTYTRHFPALTFSLQQRANTKKKLANNHNKLLKKSMQILLLRYLREFEILTLWYHDCQFFLLGLGKYNDPFNLLKSGCWRGWWIRCAVQGRPQLGNCERSRPWGPELPTTASTCACSEFPCRHNPPRLQNVRPGLTNLQ